MFMGAPVFAAAHPMALPEQDSAVQAAPSERERALVSERTGFGRILAALHDAALEPAGWSGAAALIDEALGVHGSTLACGDGDSEFLRRTLLGVGLSANAPRFEIPPAMCSGARQCVLECSHLSGNRWRLEERGNAIFAAAIGTATAAPSIRIGGCGRLPLGILLDSVPLLIITPCRQSPKEITQMASTKERLTQLADEHLDLGSDPDFDAQLADAGVSSVAAVAFFKEVNEAFNLSLQAEDCLQFRTLGILAAYIDDHSG